MFSEAVKKVAQYTRSIHTIQRLYKNDKVHPVASTLFFVNEEGCAITTKHTIEMLLAGEQIFKNYRAFLNEKKQLPDDYRYESMLQELEEKYHLDEKKICDMKNSFIGCVEPFGGFDWFRHPKYDLAIIRFKDYQKVNYSGYAVFSKSSGPLQPGRFLCRLGFPFPEFNNFKYDVDSDQIIWTKEGRQLSPSFPVEGMVTRNIQDDTQLFGIEMSTPGFKGYGGAPLFDQYGIVYGMQFQINIVQDAFNPLPYNVIVNGQSMVQTSSPFMTLGHCIHSDVIKAFLKENNIKYYEEDLYGGKYAN